VLPAYNYLARFLGDGKGRTVWKVEEREWNGRKGELPLTFDILNMPLKKETVRGERRIKEGMESGGR